MVSTIPSAIVLAAFALTKWVGRQGLFLVTVNTEV